MRSTTLRLPEDLYQWLRRFAFERDGVSQNDVIVKALENLRATEVVAAIDDARAAIGGEGGPRS